MTRQAGYVLEKGSHFRNGNMTPMTGLGGRQRSVICGFAGNLFKRRYDLPEYPEKSSAKR